MSGGAAADTPAFVLVAHVTERPPDDVLRLLGDQPSCRRLVFTSSTDTPDTYTLIAEFDSVAGYRQALAPFEVRTSVVPWLATAGPGSGVGETVFHAFHHQGGSSSATFVPTVTPDAG